MTKISIEMTIHI